MPKKLRLSLESLKVESLQMPAVSMRAVTTSMTCPTKCDTDMDCNSGHCSMVGCMSPGC